jgi:hypothetical protein
VPSGRNDGTGVAVSGFPHASVGRANGLELSSRPMGTMATVLYCLRQCGGSVLACGCAGCSSSSSSSSSTGTCCGSHGYGMIQWGDGAAGWCGRRKAWELTSIVVQNPVNTITESKRHSTRRAVCYAAGCTMLLMVLLALLLNHVYCDGKGAQCARCNSILLEHGTLTGQCDGSKLGGQCTYAGCDAGYVLVPRSIEQGQQSQPAAAAAAAAAAAGAGGHSMMDTSFSSEAVHFDDRPHDDWPPCPFYPDSSGKSSNSSIPAGWSCNLPAVPSSVS